MADLLGRGSTWLHGKRDTNASKAVSYAREADSVSLSATKTGRRDSLLTVPDPIRTQTQEMDWLITAADLVLNGDVAIPKVGDRITETIDGQDFIWQVLATDSEACWRWADRNNSVYRVHTKLI